MKKRAIAAVTAFVSAISIEACIVSAADEAHIAQYYSTEENITVYTSGAISEQITAYIAGVECEAVSYGDVYYNAEKYETVFLIDSSRSMQSFSDDIDSFLKECIDKKRDNEYYSIGVFSSGNSPEYIISDENNQYNIEKCLDKISYEFDSTYIYDNLLNTIKNLYSDDESVYRRIVLITDGNENSARGITIDDVISEIDSSPVPIYTVTLQTSTKNNVENLKNIARLARKSYAEDIRITNGGDAVAPAAVLIEAAKNVCCISITPDRTVLDGSIKAVEISDGTVTIKSDVRLAMSASDYEITEITETTVTEEAKTEIVSDGSEDKNDGKANGVSVIIAIAAIAIAAACIVIIVVFVIKEKKKTSETDEPVSLADNDDTMIISGRSGQTEILIDNNPRRLQSVILRDIADSMRTFEVQLSADGAIIGRSSDLCNIVVDYDKSISRKHCKIYLQNGKVFIEDLSSGNKTYVNNIEIISPHVLNNADEIKMGRTGFKVTIK